MRLIKFAVTVENAEGVQREVYPRAVSAAAAIKKIEEKVAEAGTSWKVVSWRVF